MLGPLGVHRALRRLNSIGFMGTIGSMTQAVESNRAAAPAVVAEVGWLGRLWRRRVIAAVVWGCCVVGGFAYLFLAPPVFESFATLSAAKPADGSSSPTPAALYVQSDVIRSADVLSDALSQSPIRGLPTLRDQKDPLTFLIQSLSVSVDSATLQIQVGIPAASGDDSAKIVNAVVNAYLTRQNQSLATQHADKGTATAMQKFKEANPEFITHESAESIGHRLATLNDALAAAQVEMANAKAELVAGFSKLKYPKTTAEVLQFYRPKNIFGALDGQEDDIQSQLGPLQNKQALQRQTLGEQNPLVQRTQQQIDALVSRQADVDQQKSTVLAGYLHQQYDMAAAKVDELRSQIDAQQAEAKAFVEKSATMTALEGNAGSSDPQITDVPAVLTLSEVAAASSTPISPKPVPVLSEALVLGLGLGIFVGSIRL
jgi:capsular polysaccharide biosynthesis protein